MKKYLVIMCAILIIPTIAKAEYRSIAIEISRVKDNNIKVSIYSQVKDENKKDISVAEATEILRNAKGWGSGVGVAIITDGAEISKYVELLKAIAENPRLNLEYLKQRREGGMGESILKYYKLIE